ncbi:phage holin family protein [Corynebacterium sp. ES2794-CONJ1]|uniref:phage holin family protein n=1 Tax=unclassified Corynebacterium TaxID=2624378 RepID=UPI002167E6D9|nr:MULTISPECIES: phage holin family protein [unclassified Corynebacterium]MCS4492092.1 phage holin family protein [Corynebacterium sp. ES2715-CONJ3]MCS4532200.1 phage holin family protein [Corynebacterium sp. ES2730-CONJ]MCU9519596.1 phage holin family protein [Corynebacterium sp. ES2794-CONJ1]
MKKENGLFTEGPETFEPQVSSIPLAAADSDIEGSFGNLVSNATEQVSSLVRSEIELAKTEITHEAKKIAFGGGLFGVAGVIALYSSFFFFFFLAELLNIWLDRWASFLIVFLGMIIVAAILALIGWKKVKSLKKPKKTIESVGELKNIVPKKQSPAVERRHSGLYS